MLLPEKWVNYLATQPETGMGYHIVDMVVKGIGLCPNVVVFNGERIAGEWDFPVDSIESIKVTT